QTLICIEGTVRTPPELRTLSDHPLARFHHHAPIWRFGVHVTARIDIDGAAHRAVGDLIVSVPADAGEPDVTPGDVVRITGWWTPPGPPMNPGASDVRPRSIATGSAGWLRTSSPAMIERHSRAAFGAFEHLRQRLRHALRLPQDDAAGALVDALLTGNRRPQLNETTDAMQRLGLAHLLAISGLHVAMVIAPIMLVLRGTRRFARWHGVILIVIAGAILWTVDVRVPIARSAIMTAIIGLGIATDRRIAAVSMVSIALIILLIVQPFDVVTPGFQLSFGVVFALVMMARPVRRRWFGDANRLSATWPRWIFDRCADTVAASTVAWLIATPIVAYHFGVLSPLAIPLTILMSPLISIILLLGILRAMIVLCIGDHVMMLDFAITFPAHGLLRLGAWMDAFAWSSVTLPRIPAIWTFTALSALLTWGIARTRRIQRLAGATCILSALWLLIIILHTPSIAGVRITMLDVGDGSCYVVQSERSAVLFDAGSLIGPDYAGRLIIRALRALDVRSLDAVIISHPNLDHYNALIDLLDTVPIERLLITPQFAHAARFGLPDHSPITTLMRIVEDHHLPVELLSAGDTRTFGAARWTILHPRADDTFDTDNDASLVIQLHAFDRSILFTGDIQARAMRALLQRTPDLHADVLELPHHGSAHDTARTFVETIAPAIILQSTGERRLNPDRWMHLDDDTDPPCARYTTARDGAVTVVFSPDGSIDVRPAR
ncbi:MAG: DNA internalization-related competence protein ComEC/Rec2, partial [Phycisphaerales bacterium]|nr:DNA internalization-related competence protein ComEC/Rec2 [Phycisphaerales bacterium]